MKKKILRAIFLILPIILIFAVTIFDPKRYSQAILEGLRLYVTAVLPTLFPMLIFSGLFIALKVADGIGKLLEKPCQTLFNCPSLSGYILVISMLSGYPVGAKLIADYYKAGLIDKEVAKKISSFTMTSGPMFIIGTVGGVFFNNVRIGYIILISHYLGAILNGIIFCRKASKTQLSIPVISEKQENVLYDVFNNGVATIALVGAFITFFYMLTEMLVDFKIVEIIENLGGKMLSAIVVGFVEMTRGTQMVSQIKHINIEKIIAVTTAMISFGGLSVTLQATAFLKSAQITTAYYLTIKLAQAIVSGIIAYLIAIFLGGTFL